MNELKRYLRALKSIASHEPAGPVDEWAEAEAYHEVKEIARSVLYPEEVAAERLAARQAEQRIRKRVKQLRKEASAGKRHYYRDRLERVQVNASRINPQYRDVFHGYRVCVLGTKCELPAVVEVKVEERIGEPDRYTVGSRFEVNECHLKDSIEEASQW